MKHVLSYGIILICAALLSPCIFADNTPATAPTVSASLSPASLPYHHSATLTLIVEAEVGSEVEWPTLGGLDKMVEFAEKEIVQKKTESGRISWQRAYGIDPIKPGLYRLPDLVLRVKKESDVKEIKLPLMSLDARELTDAEKLAADKFADATSIGSFSGPTISRVWFLLPLAVLIAVAAYFLMRRRKKVTVAEPPPSAWDVALARLRELQFRNLPMQEKIEPYYVDLSMILRYYIEDRFSIHAPELTTPEFLEITGENENLTEEQKVFLETFLRHCDRVKFARHEPGAKEMEDRLDEVERFVKDTIPKAPEENMEDAA